MPALPLLPIPKDSRISFDFFPAHNNARQILNDILHPTLHQRSTTSTLQKRALYNCSYYDTSCGRYRTVVIIIIILVLLLKVIIIFLLFRRHQKKKERRTAEATRIQAETDAGTSYEAPPPGYYASVNAPAEQVGMRGGVKNERAQVQQMEMPRTPEPAMRIRRIA
ncbi:hypothetical protein BDV96DRAFT_239913 [Lophiotrema nucula]|uniref:Uncharacterized protein n=1 Tax=Lophiotrema nucula TaxID=690887 RepID=A0A6A5YRS9_9PLEO|nr:hypothetical protein BDV96DRAFT_239913 [Lophiotrema nucula]